MQRVIKFALKHPVGLSDAVKTEPYPQRLKMCGALHWCRLSYPRDGTAAAGWGRVTAAAGRRFPRGGPLLNRAGRVHKRHVPGADGSLEWSLPGGEINCHVGLHRKESSFCCGRVDFKPKSLSLLFSPDPHGKQSMPINGWAPQLVPLMQWICGQGRAGVLRFVT